MKIKIKKTPPIITIKLTTKKDLQGMHAFANYLGLLESVGLDEAKIFDILYDNVNINSTDMAYNSLNEFINTQRSGSIP